MIIEFTDTYGISEDCKPVPASKLIPEWYKNTESYIGGVKVPGENGSTKATVKKCIPVFDAITAGYLILLPADVWVTLKEIDGQTVQWFEWANFGLISWHPIDQAPLHPARKPYPYAKFNNPWSIKTPKGYSCLFVQPFHREAPFTVLPGVVDTDTYIPPVNFPMVINDPKFEGLIPMGTPIVQVIPFKRDSWNIEFGSEETYKKQIAVTSKLRSKFYDKYKTMFWSKKEYK
jgi:hypothetical protein